MSYLLDSPENDEDMQLANEFFELIEDDEKLCADIFNALQSDDEEEFENIILTAMGSDDEFSSRMMDLFEGWDDDEPDGEYIDIGSLGLNPDSPYPVAEMMWGPNDDKYRLDDTYYGKDYPISHDIYIFRVLKSLKKHNNLDYALLTAGMSGAVTPHAVESQLRMMGLIDDEVSYDNWDEFAHDCLTVSDLKDILRQNNLKVSGKKQELIDRIAQNRIPLNEFKSNKVLVSQKGDEFLSQNPWIKFYDAFLDKFSFNDFVKYLDNNEGDLIDVTIGYLKRHLELAKKEMDIAYISDCSIALEMISEGGEKFLKKLK
ncbi:SAP domain-containing protein [uncultured Methanobrevibacter sp.]|uniref:SAP domain-containing protein n=1 Tax=uncultured Methanobrevibacter sp. TaxID=253161 RepID=UPI002627465F|nr:SAP domain-containing protein [uncultured Methanobrevibacter sp.]